MTTPAPAAAPATPAVRLWFCDFWHAENAETIVTENLIYRFLAPPPTATPNTAAPP